MKRKPAVNAKTVCITEDVVLEELKQKAEEKAEAERQKELKKLARLQKRREKEEKRLAVQQRKKEKKDRRVQREKADVDKQVRREETVVDRGEQSEDDNDAICPICGASFAETGGLWICCETCLQWYDFKCTKLKNPRRLPKSYFCALCKADS